MEGFPWQALLEVVDAELFFTCRLVCRKAYRASKEVTDQWLTVLARVKPGRVHEECPRCGMIRPPWNKDGQCEQYFTTSLFGDPRRCGGTYRFKINQAMLRTVPVHNQAMECVLRKKRRELEKIVNGCWQTQERLFLQAKMMRDDYNLALFELQNIDVELIPYAKKPRKARIQFNNSKRLRQ